VEISNTLTQELMARPTISLKMTIKINHHKIRIMIATIAIRKEIQALPVFNKPSIKSLRQFSKQSTKPYLS
jgi:hypothetical protein